MRFGRRRPKFIPIPYPPPAASPSPAVFEYDYGDMPSPPLPPGFRFDPYHSILQPDEVYLAGVFLSQIVNFTTRPQTRNPFAIPLKISGLIFPEWVSSQIRSAVYTALPPDLLKSDGVALILQCPIEFAEQLRQQVQPTQQPWNKVIYFGWAPIPCPDP